MTGPGAGADPGAHGRRHGVPRPREHRPDTPGPPEHRHVPPTPYEERDGEPQPAHPVAAFFRANPQVLVLLVVCLVLGIGTFLAVLFGLVTAGSDQTNGEPSGAILGAHAVLPSVRWLIG